jgi:hypothetical protein
VEINLLSSIQDLVEANYVDGIPRHHLDIARNKTYHPFDKKQSCIFVTEYEDFKEMSPTDIQDIFRDRHILVLNTPFQGEPFGRYSLETITSVQKIRNMNGMPKDIYIHISVWLLITPTRHCTQRSNITI